MRRACGGNSRRLGGDVGGAVLDASWPCTRPPKKGRLPRRILLDNCPHVDRLGLSLAGSHHPTRRASLGAEPGGLGPAALSPTSAGSARIGARVGDPDKPKAAARDRLVPPGAETPPAGNLLGADRPPTVLHPARDSQGGRVLSPAQHNGPPPAGQHISANCRIRRSPRRQGGTEFPMWGTAAAERNIPRAGGRSRGSSVSPCLRGVT